MKNEEEFFVAQLFKRRIGKVVIWSFILNGIEVKLTSRDLISQRRFQQKVMIATGILPPLRSRHDYETWVNSLLKDVIEIDSPALDQRAGDV